MEARQAATTPTVQPRSCRTYRHEASPQREVSEAVRDRGTGESLLPHSGHPSEPRPYHPREQPFKSRNGAESEEGTPSAALGDSGFILLPTFVPTCRCGARPPGVDLKCLQQQGHVWLLGTVAGSVGRYTGVLEMGPQS